jgi:cell division protein FtsL
MSAVESWFAPAVVAEPLPRPRRRTAATAKPKARKRQQRSFRVRLPLVWMIVFAVLLVGVVTLNVAVLRANVSTTDLDKQIAQRQGAIRSLSSQLSRMTAPPRIAKLAGQAGLVLAPAAATSYLDLARRK